MTTKQEKDEYYCKINKSRTKYLCNDIRIIKIKQKI